MRDAHLNNVLAQYFPDGNPTAAFAPSRIVEEPVRRSRVPGHDRRHRRDTRCLAPRSRIDRLLHAAATRRRARRRSLDRPATASTRSTGSAATTARSTRRATRSTTRSASTRRARTASPCSPKAGRTPAPSSTTSSARREPIRTSRTRSAQAPHRTPTTFSGGIRRAAARSATSRWRKRARTSRRSMTEVPLASGGKTVPVQLMWSNAVAGPEGPIARKHASAMNSHCLLRHSRLS